MQLWVASTRDNTRAVLVPGLEQAGWRCVLFDDGESVERALIDGQVPDALFIETPLPPWEAAGLLSRVRSGEAWVDLPMVVMSEDAATSRVELLDLGADDVVDPLVSVPELLARLRRRTALKRRTDALRADGQTAERLAMFDPLTEVHNRRYLHLRLEDEFRRAQRYDNPLALVLADLDQFRGINEAAGHLMGDSVLRAVAHCVRGCIRETDTLARAGGDEFACLLPQTHLAGALTVAERIRRDVGALRTGPASELLVTASVGVASFPAAHVQTAEELVRAADASLARAKREGRNRVCLADPGLTGPVRSVARP
jgi:two-component system cell cycle response regulator